MTTEDRESLFRMRYERLQELARLNAPRKIIAREAILIACALESPDGRAKSLIPFILTEFSDNIGKDS